MTIGTTAALLGGSLLGAAGSAYGAHQQNKMAKRAAKGAQFNPWNVNVGGGSASFDPRTRTATATADPTTAAIMALLGQRATGAAGGGYGGGMAGFTGGLSGLMPGLFQDAQTASTVDPAILQRFQNTLGTAMGGQLNATNALFGGAQNYMSGAGPGQAQAGQLFNQGMGMLQAPPGQSYQDVAQGRVDLLRQQAAPYEQQALGSFQQNLFNTGRLDTSGGLRRLQAFGKGLGEADLARQMEGQNLAESLYGRDLSAAIQRQGIGASAANAGMGGLFTGAGMGLDFANAGVGANLGLANMGNMGFGAEGMFSDLINARAQQRMGSAVDLFGFGQGVLGTELQQALAAMGGFSAGQDQTQSLIGLGGQLGQAGAQAGANSGQFMMQQGPNPWAGLAQGLGTSMISNPGLFGGGMGMSIPVYSGGGVPMLPQPNLSQIKIQGGMFPMPVPPRI